MNTITAVACVCLSAVEKLSYFQARECRRAVVRTNFKSDNTVRKEHFERDNRGLCVNVCLYKRSHVPHKDADVLLNNIVWQTTRLRCMPVIINDRGIRER